MTHIVTSRVRRGVAIVVSGASGRDRQTGKEHRARARESRRRRRRRSSSSTGGGNDDEVTFFDDGEVVFGVVFV